MIIVCPNCSTRYEVAAQAIGDTGRSVQCASCQRSWHAEALVEDDFSSLLEDALIAEPGAKKKKSKRKKSKKEDEDALDTAFEAEEDLAAGVGVPGVGEHLEGEETGKRAVGKAINAAQDVMNSINDENEVELTSYAARRRQQIERMKRARRIAKRHKEISRALPMAKLRRNVSLGAIGFTVVMTACLFFFQTDVVRFFPDMAGLYRLFGQTVNVVGLDFSDVKTDRAWKDGHEMLTVRSKVSNITNRMIYLPPIRVALLDEAGEIAYEWNTTPGMAVLEAGGSFEFETELASPPSDVKFVRMKFLDWERGANRPAVQNEEQRSFFDG